MAHDFQKFPELTNAQLQFYYFESPHKQIFESFTAEVIKVHDGDSITLRWRERDFDFPLRIINIAAPELKERNGRESQKYMEDLLLGEKVDIVINPDLRVEKWGRLLGYVMKDGVDVGNESIRDGMSTPWEGRNTGVIKDIGKELKKFQV